MSEAKAGFGMNEVISTYVYEFEAEDKEAERIMPQPIYVNCPERRNIIELMDEFGVDHVPKGEAGPFKFKVTERLVTEEELRTNFFTHDKSYGKANEEEGVTTLYALTQKQAEEKVCGHHGADFWIAPKGVHPLKEGLRIKVTLRDVEEKKDVWSDGAELSRFELKLRLMNETNFNRADDAPFDFYFIEGRDMF